MSVAGLELSFFLSLVCWIGALGGWIGALVLSLTRWLGRRVRSGSRSLCVLSLALSVLVFVLGSLCILSLTLSVFCVTRK